MVSDVPGSILKTQARSLESGTLNRVVPQMIWRV